MKTIRKFREILTGKPALAANLFAGILFLASCQKEDMMQPSVQNVVSAKAINPPSAIHAPYAMVTIEHLPGHGLGPNYKVTLLSDGSALFEGRQNVPVIGTVKFSIFKERLAYIKNMFEAAHFFSIKDDIYIYPDAPTFLTTYCNGEVSKTLKDMDTGIPQILIQLRRTTEGIMQVDRFLAVKKPIHDKSSKPVSGSDICNNAKCANPNSPAELYDAIWNQPIARNSNPFEAAWNSSSGSEIDEAVLKQKNTDPLILSQPAPQNTVAVYDNGWDWAQSIWEK